MDTGNETSRTMLSEDDRYDLQFAAAAAERRNQPRMLVLGAAALLAASLLSVVFGRGSLSSAKASIAREQSRESEIARMITILESDEGSGENLVFTRDPRAKLKIHEATKQAGLTDVTNEPTSRPRGLLGAGLGDGLKMMEYGYTNLRSHSIETLLGVVQASLNAVEGLEVGEIMLKAGDKQWTMDITYTHLIEED